MAASPRNFAPRWNMWLVRKSRSSSITIGPDDDIEQRRQDIVSAVTKVDSGAGVVVLTDMFGGTPSTPSIVAKLEAAYTAEVAKRTSKRRTR